MEDKDEEGEGGSPSKAQKSFVREGYGH